MDPQHQYEQDTYLASWQGDWYDEDAIEELMADITKYLSFWEIAGRVAPRIPIPGHDNRWDMYLDPATGLWVCQLKEGEQR